MWGGCGWSGSRKAWGWLVGVNQVRGGGDRLRLGNCWRLFQEWRVSSLRHRRRTLIVISGTRSLDNWRGGYFARCFLPDKSRSEFCKDNADVYQGRGFFPLLLVQLYHLAGTQLVNQGAEAISEGRPVHVAEKSSSCHSRKLAEGNSHLLYPIEVL